MDWISVTKMIDKKEIKKQYKQTLPQMGIYQIKNLKNGKILIGSSLNLHAKSNSYLFQLKSCTHMNSELQKDYNTFGENAFIFEILDTLEPKDDLNYDYREDLEVLEELWKEKTTPYGDKGYNKKKLSENR